MPFERGPYLTNATFCEQVIEDKSGVLSLIRLVDRIEVTRGGPEVPDEMPPYALDWFLVITLKSGDARGTHSVKIEPTLPSGEKLSPVTLSAHLEGGNRGMNLISRINMELRMPGVYWFKVYIGDEFVTQVPIEVIYSRIVTPGPRA